MLWSAPGGVEDVVTVGLVVCGEREGSGNENNCVWLDVELAESPWSASTGEGSPRKIYIACVRPEWKGSALFRRESFTSIEASSPFSSISGPHKSSGGLPVLSCVLFLGAIL